ncbi:uncharacterized protein [Euwallacea fornicatus]|uniref:uncharacterized protein isoform X2 n=1 Tax=Euwallacea fornicatus TaxID=995702 RepID=UPI00338F0DB9
MQKGHQDGFKFKDLNFYFNELEDSDCQKVYVDDLIRNSKSFPISFPVDSVKTKKLRLNGISDSVLERNINSVYPILHEAALPLFCQFLKYKRSFGSKVEKQFYKNFTVLQLIDRLLLKRAVVFYGRFDKFMLLDGFSNAGNWEIIGTDKEAAPRILENCLSYDEIKLSALLSVSSYTYFINDGDRDNMGKFERNREKVMESGVIIGLIGARFCKPDVMEYQEIIISKEQNVHGKGYGQTFAPTLPGLFINFYGGSSLTYKEMRHEFSNTKKYTKLRDEKYFNNEIYCKRLSLSIDTLLLEANARGLEAQKLVFVHVVGIGLGVWRASSHQNKLFMKCFCMRLRVLSKTLTNISDVRFSYISETSCGIYKHRNLMPIENHINGGIKIHIIDKNPHEKLLGEDKDKLLVVSYAWDGNSLPGNEFWLGQLAASGDPAAACSTQIAELHNPHINSRVRAAHLRIATLSGLEKFPDYMRKFQNFE